MAIDFREQKRQSEQELEDYLRAPVRPTSTESILRGRGRLLSQELPSTLESVAQTYGVSPSIVGAGRERAVVGERGLTSGLEAKVRERQLNQRRQQANLIFYNAMRQLTNAGYDVQSAREYARQIVLDQMEQGFKAVEAEKERKAGLEREDIYDKYGDLDVESSQRYEQEAQDRAYQMALTRAGLSLAGQIGTGYALNRYYNPKAGKDYTKSLESEYTRKGLNRFGESVSPPVSGNYERPRGGVGYGRRDYPVVEEQFGGYERRG